MSRGCDVDAERRGVGAHPLTLQARRRPSGPRRARYAPAAGRSRRRGGSRRIGRGEDTAYHGSRRFFAHRQTDNDLCVSELVGETTRICDSTTRRLLRGI